MPDNGYHDKIRKVLAMLEGVKTPGEAQAASLALQRLMARSGLTAEQVDALGAENVQFPVTQDGVYIGTNDVAWKKMLATVIGENFRCEAIACSAERNARMKTVVFVGHKDDVQVASECYRATIKAAQRCFKRYSKWRTERRCPIDARSAKVRNSYYVGFVEGLDDAYSRQLEEIPELAISLQVPSDVRAFVGLMNLGEGRKPRIDAGIRGIRSNGYEDGYRYGTGRTLD